MTLSVSSGEEIARASRNASAVAHLAKRSSLVSPRAAVNIAINPTTLIASNGGAGRRTRYEIGDSEGCAAEIY